MCEFEFSAMNFHDFVETYSNLENRQITATVSNLSSYIDY